MKYLKVNNFFKDPNSILELTKTLEFYTFDKHPETNAVGRYAGKRSLQLHNLYSDFFNQLCYDIISNLIDFSKIENCDWRVSSYFSIISSYDNTKDVAVIHQDIDVLYAGVVYLTKNIDANSGTSLYKQQNGNYIKEYEFMNEFNKMIMYDATIPHGINKFVDDRLSILFFIKDLKYTLK